MRSGKLRFCRGTGSVIANQEQGQVVRLAGAAREILDRLEHQLLQFIERGLIVPGEQLHQPRHPEQIFLRVHGFCNAVAEQHAGPWLL